MRIKQILSRLRYPVTFAVVFLSMVATLYSQQLNFNFKETQLKTVLKKVTEQTDYNFVYSDTLKAINSLVSVSSTNENIEQFCSKFFPTINIVYKIQGKQVVLSPKAMSSTLASPAKSQGTIPVSGVVIDALGEALPGVYVTVKGANIGVITDIMGRYTINAPKESTLVFKFLGMKDFEIPAVSTSTARVILEMDKQVLADVIVTGYQTLSKERSTGSFSIVSQKKLENKLQPSVQSILEGQSSGVVLTKEGDIEIRGVSTITGVKAPLIVVDGYPLIGNGVGLETINPDNIEQITVLKDAVAASIYGARASNGVIVVTTKKAEQGIVRLSYRGVYGVTMKPDLGKLTIATTENYMDAELDLYNQSPNDAYNSYNGYSKVSDYAYLLMAKDKGLISSSEADAQIAALKGYDALAQIEKYLMKPKQSMQHNIELSGGSERNLLKGSLRLVNEKGDLSPNKSSRMIFDINNIWKPKDWITIRILSNINYSKSHTSKNSITSMTGFYNTSRIQRYSNMFDSQGNQNLFIPIGQRRIETYLTYPGMRPVTYNPAIDNALEYSNMQNLQLRIGGDVTLKLFDWMTAQVGGSWSKGFNETETIQDAESLAMRLNFNDGTSRTNPTKRYIPEGGRIDGSDGSYEAMIIRSQININKSFSGDEHRLTAMIGNEISKDTYLLKYMPTRLGYDPISASYNSGFDPYEYNKNTGNYKSDMLFGRGPSSLPGVTYGNNYGVRDNRFVSWYGNGSYEYKNKYIISASARLDLTNFFGTDPKYRYKPTWSIGGTYKISEESFFSGLKSTFNRVNIRGSYGVNGNISLNNTPYLILGIGSHNNTTGGISNSISSYPNNSLRWERTGIFNIGIDASILKNRLNFTLDYYKKNSTDLIANDQIDETRGIGSIPQNVGSLTNSGIEFTLDAEIARTADFNWTAYLITSYNNSNVTHYNINRPYFTSYGRAQGLLVEGYPMDGFWGARFAQIDNTGKALYYNKAGDKVDGGSLKGEDAVFLGTLRPKVDMSLTNSFRYKNFEASFMFIAKLGHKYRKDSFSGSNYANRNVGERWRKPGDEATVIYPKLTSWNMDLFYYPYSDHLVASANFLKLRDLSIGYNIPKSTINKIGISNAKIYFQARNLFYLTAKGVDIDPETAELNKELGTGADTNQGFTSMQLRPEFYFGLSINL